jgi:hypothetical protein
MLVATASAKADQFSKCKTADECKARIAQDQATLSKLQAGWFVSVYTDSSNKLSWSKALPGTYSNGCADANGKYDKSKCSIETDANNSTAAKACRDLGEGVRLPTEQEIESLIKQFDHSNENYGPRLTETGRAAMQDIFGDMDNISNDWFWSSSVLSNDPNLAYFFDGINGYVDYGYYVRNNDSAVRCVSGR